ncbi:TetR/AcrR family transcriptional regulator [Reichenbachiella agarivorans]|uniref:TetR/AcrR family transcriptional regulator n=1 Tax=Reichenbachiella agarivorans TaxID=2979464 RepID=A0ABY6CQG0_9BACT|nr:TetR/AcrR family transcriptional regulator [Reichenbachiella agarivorans]UXP32742.1 TetR/AcrR family transcriptional regulator [Reichenbachiella agarivorans]
MVEKKQAIFDSALELINECGFHGTSMSQLAKHANVAAGTIYHYFESKEAMICALHTNIVDQLLETLTSTDDKNLSFRLRFEKRWKCIFHFHIDRPQTLRFYEQFVNSPFYFNYPKRKEIQLYFSTFFQEGIDEGIIINKNPEMISGLFFGSVISALKMRLYRKVELTEEDLNDIIGMQWKGMTL